MRNNEWMSFDGVVQSVGADDDTSNGFAHGVTDAVRALKKEDGGDLHIIGCTQPAQTLLKDDLVDGLRVMIDPLVLGGGKRFLPDDAVKRPMELRDSAVTSTGAILATYALTAV